MESFLVFSYGQIIKNPIVWRIQIFDIFYFFRDKIMKLMWWSLKNLKYHFWVVFEGLRTQISCFFFEKNKKSQKSGSVTLLDFKRSGRRRKPEMIPLQHRGDQFDQKKIFSAHVPWFGNRDLVFGQNFDPNHWFPYTNITEMSPNKPTRAFFCSTIFSS
jgi:hypothetical protein